MRVETECAAGPDARLRAISEAVLDPRAVEELQGVPCPEAQSASRPVRRLVAATGSRECPRENVVSLDRRSRGVRTPRQSDGRPAVVGAERRRLQVRCDAARALQTLDRADRRVLLARLAAPPGGAIEVAELRNELRKRDRV